MIYAVAFVLAFAAGVWGGWYVGVSGSVAVLYGIVAGVVNMFVAHYL